MRMAALIDWSVSVSGREVEFSEAMIATTLTGTLTKDGGDGDFNGNVEHFDDKSGGLLMSLLDRR